MRPGKNRGPWRVLCDNETFLRAKASLAAYRRPRIELIKLPPRSPDFQSKRCGAGLARNYANVTWQIFQQVVRSWGEQHIGNEFGACLEVLQPSVLQASSSRIFTKLPRRFLPRRVLLSRADKFLFTSSRSQTIPRRSQNRHKISQDRSETFQDAPRPSQDRPKTISRRPKTAPRHFKMPEDSPNIAPRPYQDGPRHSKSAPRRPKMRQDHSKTVP